MIKRSRLGFIVLLALGTWTAPLFAEAPNRDVLVCHVSDLADPEAALPHIQTFGAFLAGKLGWEEGSYAVRFENNRKACLRALTEKPPAYVALSLGVFLEARTTAGLEPLVLASYGGSAEEQYRVLVKKGAYADIEALKGKVLTGDQVEDARFVTAAVFGGAVDAATHFTLERSKRPLRAIKKVKRGKRDAVLVTAVQFESLKELPFLGELAVIYESASVPRVGLARVKAASNLEEATRLIHALTNMCEDREGKTICANFGLGGFAPIPKGSLDAVIQRYEDIASQ